MLVTGQQPVLGGMLDQGEYPACHEPGRSHRAAGAGDLRYLDDATAGRDLDPPSRAGGDDLVGLHLAAAVDDDLHPITFHTSSMPVPAHSHQDLGPPPTGNVIPVPRSLPSS